MGITAAYVETDQMQEVIHGLICGYGLTTVLSALQQEFEDEAYLNEAGYTDISEETLNKLYHRIDQAMKPAYKIIVKSGMFS